MKPGAAPDRFPKTDGMLAAIPPWQPRRRELLIAYRDEVGAEALERQIVLGEVRYWCCWSLRAGPHAGGCRRADEESAL